MLNNLLDSLVGIRIQNSFNSLPNYFRDLAKEWDETLVFKNKRQRITKHIVDELSEMREFQNQRVLLLSRYIDFSNKHRFQSLCDLSNIFEITESNWINSYPFQTKL